MLRRITIIIAIFSLVLCVLSFSLLYVYESKEENKNKSKMYLDKKGEIYFLSFMFFSSIFSLCLIYNIPFLLGILWDLFKDILDV